MNRARKEKRTQFWTALAKDWLLCVWLSFLGWLWEMLFMLFAYKKFADRGFLSLPICPIYGITIMLAFYLFGTPHRGRYALKRIKPAFWRYALYLIFAFLLPTIAELIVGLFYYEVYGVRLWNYSNRPLNLFGYVSLPISLAWAVALTLFMRIFFLPMRNFFQSAKTKPAVIIASILFVAALTDFIYNLCLLILG
ncbi:MAG: putative ABC transporter permease [Clostridia bacterium]|nr:putative ABC transporter permease [Clostridia bacterium]